MKHNDDFEAIFGLGITLFFAVLIGVGSCSASKDLERHEAQQAAQAEYKAHCDDLEGASRCKCLETLAMDEAGAGVWREKPFTRAAKACWDREKPVSKTKKVLRFVADRL